MTVCVKVHRKKGSGREGREGEINSLKFPMDIMHRFTAVDVMKLCELWMLFILVILRQQDPSER